jgi:hypothetical protein
MNAPVATLYLGWLRARLRSTVVWTLGVAAIVVVNAAFYPSLKNFFADFQNQGSAGSLRCSVSPRALIPPRPLATSGPTSIRTSCRGC